MKEEKYLMFPISMIQGLIIERENNELIQRVFDNAMDYGIVKLANERFERDFKKTAKWLEIKLGENFQNTASSIFNKYSFGKQVMCSCNIRLLFDFRDNPKTEFEIRVFCAYLALRSMLGVKAYWKFDNDILVARMFGYGTKQDYLNSGNRCTNTEKEIRLKYSKRYQLDKVKEELRINWGLSYYSNRTKGFYVSFSVPLKDLIRKAEERKASYKKNVLREEQKAAYREVLSELKPKKR